MVESQDRLELETLRNKKLCIIGDGGTGKTSVLHRYINDEFLPTYVPTVFETSIICDFNGTKVNLRKISI